MSVDIRSSLTTAVRAGRLAEVRQLIESHNLNNSSLSESHYYYLLLDAIRRRHTDIAKLLISKGCRVNDEASISATTPLHHAVKSGKAEMVNMLLERQANIRAKDENGKTPLCHAIERFAVATRTKTELKIITKVLKNNGTDAEQCNVLVTIRDVAVKPCCINTFIDDLARGCSIANNILINGRYISCVRTFTGREAYKSLHFSSSDSGRAELVILLLQKSNNHCSHTRNEKNLTTLFLGAAGIEKKIIKSLFEYGANVDSEDGTGRTILQLAVEAGCSKLVEQVLQSSPDVNYKNNRNSLKIAVTRLAGEQQREKIGSSCYSYETHTEIEYKRIVETLIKYGFTVESKDAWSREFLLASVATGFTIIVKDLLKYRADVNMLHTAADNKQTEMAKLLLANGADVNGKDTAGKVPILYAIRNVDVNITKLFLSNGAKVKDNADLLNTAIIMGNREIVDLLLEYEPGIDINAADDDGITALHCTALDKRDSIRFVFESDRGVDVIAKEEIAKLLLKRGVNVDARSKKGMTALAIAAGKQRAKLVEHLLKFNADINSIDEHGNGLLHIAANNNDLEVVKILLKYGTSIDARNNDGKTALYIACEHGNVKIVTTLLDYGADINIGCYQNGDTPVIGAKIGLNRTLRNDDGCTKHNNAKDYQEIIDLMNQRLLKMIALSQNMNTRNLQWIIENTGNVRSTDSLKECKKETEKMKSEKIGNSNVRFYDILAKGVNQVAIYARNESIVQILESDSYYEKFPIYSKIIDIHFRTGRRRSILLNSRSKILHLSLQCKLPEVVICEVISYLRNDDLENFIAACSGDEIRF